MSLFEKHSMTAKAEDSAEDKAYIEGFNHALKLADVHITDLNDNLAQELRKWLDQQEITGENIGTIRGRCFVPWESDWNAVVRDETALREISKIQCDNPEYQKLVDELSTKCHCTPPSQRPCEGLLAGGPCDDMHLDESNDEKSNE